MNISHLTWQEGNNYNPKKGNSVLRIDPRSVIHQLLSLAVWLVSRDMAQGVMRELIGVALPYLANAPAAA